MLWAVGREALMREVMEHGWRGGTSGRAWVKDKKKHGLERGEGKVSREETEGLKKGRGWSL